MLFHSIQLQTRQQKQCMLADRVISYPCALIVRHSVLGTFITFFLLDPLSFTVSNTHTHATAPLFSFTVCLIFSLALSLPSTFFLDIVEAKKKHTQTLIFSLLFHVLQMKWNIIINTRVRMNLSLTDNNAQSLSKKERKRMQYIQYTRCIVHICNVWTSILLLLLLLLSYSYVHQCGLRHFNDTDRVESSLLYYTVHSTMYTYDGCMDCRRRAVPHCLRTCMCARLCCVWARVSTPNRVCMLYIVQYYTIWI